MGWDLTGLTGRATTRVGALSAAPRVAVRLGLAVLSVCALFAAIATSRAFAQLPDGRGYEMVTPLDKNGIEVGAAIASTDGNSVDWEAIGGCCGASSAASTLYQSTRTASGWQTVAKTPAPPTPLEGLFAEQQPMWWSSDLSKTVYLTSACSGPVSTGSPDFCAPGNQRPQSPSASPYNDLYEQAADGTMTWLTQGPFTGAGTGPYAATWAATTPDGNSTLFDTPEQLTSDATGLASLNTPPEFLYDRNISAGTTSLIDVTSTTLAAAASSTTNSISVVNTNLFAAGQTITIGPSGTGSDQETNTIASVTASTSTTPGTITLTNNLANNHVSGEPVEALLGPDGAIAGNGNWLDDGFLPADYFGTTTNSISSDGTKVFFETPPTSEGGSSANTSLYMRDLATDTTTQLDANPGASGSAVYEGASQDGSLVFFTSNESLGGDTNSDNELYEFNTTGSQIGPDPAMSVMPISDGGDPSTAGNVEGVTAISNDGSHVYFVAKGVLASNTGADGTTATSGNQNFYVFNTATGDTTFIGTLGSGITGDNRDKTYLTTEPDTSRAAVPTPDGSVLVFLSTANLTKQNPYPDETPATTTLTAATTPAEMLGAVTIPVASSTGFVVGRSIEIEGNPSEGDFSESATITGIPDSTDLTVNDSGYGLFYPHNDGDTVVQRPTAEIYRYSAADNSLICLSCTADDVSSLGGNGLGASGGGTYGPATDGVPMSSDGSRIFFTSADPLTPGVVSSPPIPIGLFGEMTFVQNVYEWEADGTGSCSDAGGCVSLISDGQSTTGSSLGSTTPSGNDVFFETEDQLVPQDTDGYDDIYDARVGGGFAAPATPAPPCASAEACRTSTAPTVFFAEPSSATLIEPTGMSPSFSVNSISAKQRKRFAATGVLRLTVHVNQAGKIAAVASDATKRTRTIVASASRSFFGTDGGTGTVTLRLSKAARKKLAKQHRLGVVISVSYSESGEVYVASLTLTQARGKPAGDRRSTRER